MRSHRIARLIVRQVALLCILCGSSQAIAQDWIYSAQPGDTLWDLCLEYTAKRGCWIQLGQHNNIPDGRALQPGTDIRIPVDWLLEIPIVGKVRSVQGEVSYQVQHGSKPIPLVAGQTLALGGSITTGSGTAKITLGSHSDLLLRPDSVLELSSMSAGSGPHPSSELQLDRGEVEVEVQPRSNSRFEIHTPSAIAAVRGTRYRVASETHDSTRSEVLTGKVAVQAGATVDVPAGYGLKTVRGEAPGAPKELPPAPVFEQARVDSPLPLKVRWADATGVVAWNLDLYSPGDGGELLATHRTSEPTFEFVALAEGCYTLAARGIDAEGFNGLESQLPLCVEPPVEEPRTYWGLLLWTVFTAIILI